MPLTQELEEVGKWRKSNPQLADLSDRDLAGAIERQYPGTFQELPSAGKLYQLAGHVQKFFGKTADVISKNLGDVEGVPALLRVPGRAVGMLVESAPEIGLQVLAARTGAKYLGLRPALLAGASGASGISQYARTKAEGGSPSQAIGAGLSSTLALPLALTGAGVGRRVGAKLGSEFAGRLAGATVGGIASDIIEPAVPIAFGDAQSRKAALEWLSDPINLGAMGLANTVDVVYDVAKEKGEAARENIETKKAKLKSLEELYYVNANEELARLKLIPEFEKTPVIEHRIRELTTRINDVERTRARLEEEKLRVSKQPLSLDTVPEAPATLSAQFKLLKQGKKPAVLIPTGNEFKPKESLLSNTFKRLETPKGVLYYNPELVRDDDVTKALETDTLPNILGHGALKPLAPTDSALVLRNSHGHEKLAIAVDSNNMAEAKEKLEAMLEEGDTLKHEYFREVLGWRQARQGLERTYSIYRDPDEVSQDLQEREFQNTSPEKLEMVQRSLANPNVGFRYGVVDSEMAKMLPGGDATMQIDLVDEKLEAERGNVPEANLVSTNRRLLAALGVKLPAVPKGLPMGKYTLKQIQEAGRADQEFSVQRRNWSVSLFNQLSEAVRKRPGREGPKFTMSADGKVGTKGLISALRQWADPYMFEHYERLGLNNFLKQDQVDFSAFSDWIKKNTPIIEVVALRAAQHYPTTKAQFDKDLDDTTRQLSRLSNEFRLKHPSFEIVFDMTLETATLRERGSDERAQKERSQVYSSQILFNSLLKDVAIIDELYRGQMKLNRIRESLERDPDSASVRYAAYGITPKPLAQMRNPVDILVKYPERPLESDEDRAFNTLYHQAVDESIRTQTPIPDEMQERYAQGLYRRQLISQPVGDVHYGSEAPGTLASARGYLSDDGNTFIVYEAQKQWRQEFGTNVFNQKEAKYLTRTGAKQSKMFNTPQEARRHVLEKLEEYKKFNPGYGYFFDKKADELILKAVIQHAIDAGAREVAILDAETTIITENHDLNTDVEIGPTEEVIKSWASDYNLVPHVMKDVNFGTHRRNAIFFMKPNFVPPRYTGHPLYQAYSHEAQAVFVSGDPLPENWNLTYYSVPLQNLPGRVAAATRTEPRLPITLKGMKQYYDYTLPEIMKRLFGYSGTKKVIGPAKRVSPHFGGKDTITGYAFDLKRVNKDELDRLFSIYNIEAQSNFESTLYGEVGNKVDEAKKAGKLLTMQEFLELALEGQNTDQHALFKFAYGIASNPALIRIFNLEPIKGIEVWGNYHNGEASVNLRNRSAKSLYRTSLHELSHGVFAELQYDNPTAYNQIMEYVNSLTPDQRFEMLTEFAKAAGVTGLDFDYLSGRSFDPANPKTARRATSEFIGAFVEILADHAYQGAEISPSIKQYFDWLPFGFQKFLTNLMRKVKAMFGSGYPSVAHMMNDKTKAELVNAVDKMTNLVFKNDAFQSQALQVLHKLDNFDPQEFISGLPSRQSKKVVQPMLSFTRGLGDVEHEFSLNFFKESRLVKKVKDVYEDLFLGALMRTRLKPETTDWFLTMHHYRNRIKQKEISQLAFLGQNDNNSLTTEQAITNWNKLEAELTKTARGRTALTNMSKVFEADQNLREELKKANPGLIVPMDALTSEQQMQSQYGLSPAEVELTVRLRELLKKVAEQTHQDQEIVDTYNVARLFFSKNKTQQNVQSVFERTAQLNRTGTDLGYTRFELAHYEKALKKAQRATEPDEDYVARLEGQINILRQKDAALKGLLDQEIRSLFSEHIRFDPEPGNDPFINNVSEVITKLAENRVKLRFIMRDEGYAPMTRRGRFLVRVYNTVEDEPIPGTTRAFLGFDTRKEVDNHLKKEGLAEGMYEVIDKQDIHQRARMYFPEQLMNVRDQARQEFSSMIARMRSEVRESDTPFTNEYIEILNQIETQYHPLEAEIKDVLSDKGDKFKERRWLVPGFDRNDFIPNIFEYLNFRTVTGEKAITRAKARLEMSRPEFDADPALKERLGIETDYVLNRSKEAPNLRKFMFNWYLGMSFRFMVQNMTQVPLVGIPQLVAEGTSPFKAYAYYAKALKLASDYTIKGTTGDTQFDILLKQAEKEGVTLPSAIEMFSPQTDEVQEGLDRAAAWSNGDRIPGTFLKQGVSSFSSGLGKLMRSTAIASETANRRISFLMSLLKSKAEFGKEMDLRKAFRDANLHTDYVNFVGDKSNRPGIITKFDKSPGHSVVMVLGALQTFTLNHIGQLYTFRQNWLKGSKADRAAFFTGVAHLLILAGAMGLVGAGTMEELYELVTGISLKTAIRRGLVNQATETFNLTEEAGGRIADGVLGGIPAALGVETGGSLGLGDLFFRFQPGREQSLYDVVGPIGGLVQKGKKMIDVASSNPWSPEEFLTTMRSVGRAGAPQSLNYWIRLADAIDRDSYLTPSGQPLVESLDATGETALALGFQPKSVANVRESQTQMFLAENRRMEEQRTKRDVIAKALFDYESTGNPEKLVLARETFNSYVQDRKGTLDRSSFIDSITAQVNQFRQPVTEAPTLAGYEDFARIAQSYPESIHAFPSRSSAALDELQVSSLLGQPDELMRRVQGLSSTLQQSALYDSLVQGGLPPPIASVVAQRGNAAARKLLEIQALSNPAAQGQ